MPEILTEKYVDGSEQHEDLEKVEVFDEIDGNTIFAEHWKDGRSFLYFGEQEIIETDYRFFQQLVKRDTESITFNLIKANRVRLNYEEIKRIYNIMENNKEYFT